jgi:hypothetical protein
VVIRSRRELGPGDRVDCMPGMSRLIVVRSERGARQAQLCTEPSTPRVPPPRCAWLAPPAFPNLATAPLQR